MKKDFPSFEKINCAMSVLLILIFLFMIGFEGLVFAADCYVITYKYQYKHTTGNNVSVNEIIYNNTGFVWYGKYWSQIATETDPIYATTFVGWIWDGTVWKHSPNGGGGSWRVSRSMIPSVFIRTEDTYNYPPPGTTGDSVCNPCKAPKDQLVFKCGGENNVDLSDWNDQTCTGGQCRMDPKNNQGPPCAPGQCCQ